MRRSQVAALERLLEGDETLNGEASPETRALAALAGVLEAHAAALPRPEFTADLRTQLVQQARSLPAKPPLLTRLRDLIDRATERWRYSARVAFASAAGAVALSTGGVAVAAEHALPGDVLYPVKLALEDARTFFVRGDVALGERHLDLATQRVQEAATLAAGGDQDGAARALQLADEEARAGASELIHAYQATGDGGILDTLSAWTAAMRERLTGFDHLLQGEAAAAADDLHTTLERIDRRLEAVAGACPSCVQQDTAEVGSAGQPSPHDSMLSVVPPGGAFDFGYIPPADEPFDPCPCVPVSGPDLQVPPAPVPAPGQLGPPPPDSGDTPGSNPGSGAEPPEEEEEEEEEEEDRLLPEAPGPAEEPVDALDEVLRDVIDETPVDPPDTPQHA